MPLAWGQQKGKKSSAYDFQLFSSPILIRDAPDGQGGRGSHWQNGSETFSSRPDLSGVWRPTVFVTVDVTMTLHWVIASKFVTRQRLHWHSTKSMPLGFWIILGCNDIAFVHCNCDCEKSGGCNGIALSHCLWLCKQAEVAMTLHFVIASEFAAERTSCGPGM